MMQHLSRLFFAIYPLLACLSGCQQNPPTSIAQSNNKDKNAMVLGGDADAHGCKASAGYQWSPLRKSCVRLFETGIRLNANAPYLDKSLSAFVLFDPDTTQAELHLPTLPEPLLLSLQKDDGNGTSIGQFDSLTLTKLKNIYLLSNNKNVLLYQGTNTPK